MITVDENRCKGYIEKESAGKPLMAKVIIAGTGFNNPNGSSRAGIIRRHCKIGAVVSLRREPDNQYDPNAIAVYVEAKGFFGKSFHQIGYVKSERAEGLAKRMDGGGNPKATISSFWAPPGRDHPRVSIEIIE